MHKKIEKKVFVFAIKSCLHWIVSTKKRVLVIGSQCVNQKSKDFACHYQWLFSTQFPSQWSTNMVKELALRVNQCFGPFTMLREDGSTQMGLFRHLSNHVFRGPQFWKYTSYKIFNIWCKFEKFKKYSEFFFFFLMNTCKLFALNCLY